MSLHCLPERDFIMQQGSWTYVGIERRAERRRSGKQDNFERLLKDFGLDRRFMPDRRTRDSSWLLLSEEVA